jgi:hypothetical protein
MPSRSRKRGFAPGLRSLRPFDGYETTLSDEIKFKRDAPRRDARSACAAVAFLEIDNARLMQLTQRARQVGAGRPQLVTPYLGDQPDNAARLARLGVARALPSRKIDAKTLARELGILLHDPAYAQRARELAGTIAQEDGATLAAKRIAKIVAQSART